MLFAIFVFWRIFLASILSLSSDREKIQIFFWTLILGFIGDVIAESIGRKKLYNEWEQNNRDLDNAIQHAEFTLRRFQWRCPNCGRLNDFNYCLCGLNKEYAEASLRQYDWNCPNCGNRNGAIYDYCFKCANPKNVFMYNNDMMK